MLQHDSMTTNIMEAVDTTSDTTIIEAKEDAVRNTDKIGEVDEVVGATVI